MARLEQLVVDSPDGRLVVEVRPSGVIGWSYDTGGGELVGLAVVIAAFLWNCVGRLAYRGGSSLWVTSGDGKRKERRRFTRRSTAEDAARALVPVLADEGWQGMLTAR